jgi:hypothetical protein
LLSTSSAGADVEPGNIAAETIQTAYPIQPNATYSGAFNPDTTTYHDLDYLAFTVASAGETLEFVVQNTTQPCNDSYDLGCPVYATLMDGTNQQVGGDSSAAGTWAPNGDTEIFDWTFGVPGTYYLLMESNGNDPAGTPTYAVRYGVLATGGGSSGGTYNGPTGGTSGATYGGPGSGGLMPGRGSFLVPSLRVVPHQRGTAVTVSFTLGLPTRSLMATLLVPRRHKAAKPILTASRGPMGTGLHSLSLKLPAAYRRELKQRHILSLLVRVAFVGAAGQRLVYTRAVSLKP